MKRRDFLAYIPSISSIPLIGKDIVKKESSIEIFQPESISEDYNLDFLDLMECEVHLVHKNKILAKTNVISCSQEFTRISAVGGFVSSGIIEENILVGSKVNIHANVIMSLK